MANLQSTTVPTISATTISSPKLLLNNSLTGMVEYTGYTGISDGASADIFANTGGYAQMAGLCQFFNYSSCAWFYGIFGFSISRYGLSFNNILNNASYSVAYYQDPGNVDISWLRFTNSSGCNGTEIYFSMYVNNTTSYSSPYLTRIR